MRHIISLLLENEPGALSRVVGLFSQRNYNIESLTVAPTEDPTLSRLTLTTLGHDEVIEQITKNLNKLIEGTEFAGATLEDIIKKSSGGVKNGLTVGWGCCCCSWRVQASQDCCARV